MKYAALRCLSGADSRTKTENVFALEYKRAEMRCVMLENGKPELLIPASNLEVLKTAVNYGADAVYIGGEMYGLRAKAKNFTNNDMAEGIRYAHEYGKRVFVTANITAHNRDLEGIRIYFDELREIKPDALIISDPGVFSIARDILPDTELHISTQSNNVNYETYRFWHKLGAKRVVSARELSIEEIAEIRKNIPKELEIETFVHGAMCISYSGRCLLSNYFTGRDANLGACTHPCRWKYYIMEENRPGEYLPVEENDRGTFIFNSKDLCMIEHIPDLVRAGIDSFKVEGRMKTALYVAAVARTYRQAIDDYFVSPSIYEEKKEYYLEEVSKCTYRQFTTGFFYDKPSHDAQIYDSNTYVKGYEYLGLVNKVMEDGFAQMEQKNKFSVGDDVEIMKKSGENVSVKVLEMRDEYGNKIENCPHSKQIFDVKFSECPDEMELIRAKVLD